MRNGTPAWVKDKAKKAKREAEKAKREVQKLADKAKREAEKPPVMLSGLLERLRMKPSA